MKLFYIWSDLTRHDLKEDCVLREMLDRKGHLLNHPRILLISATLYSILDSIGDWRTPTLARAPRALAPCDVFRFLRFEVTPLPEGHYGYIPPVYFTFFSFGRDDEKMQKAEAIAEKVLNETTRDLFTLYGRPALEEWRTMLDEIDHYWTFGPRVRGESQSKKYSLVLSSVLRELFLDKHSPIAG
ncbi:hypothetical protein EU545_02265 [Candidatus Thorarchaeota archaeon]|nr:MAG: hypothetical protein EU545_02265 [Candidatus Thorarchaeota archaeon]